LSLENQFLHSCANLISLVPLHILFVSGTWVYYHVWVYFVIMTGWLYCRIELTLWVFVCVLTPSVELMAKCYCFCSVQIVLSVGVMGQAHPLAGLLN